MVIRTVSSLPQADKWIFLPLAEDLKKHPIERELKKFKKNSVIIGVEILTSGQAATCLLAKHYLNNDSQLMIASADYEHHFNS